MNFLPIFKTNLTQLSRLGAEGTIAARLDIKPHYV